MRQLVSGFVVLVTAAAYRQHTAFLNLKSCNFLSGSKKLGEQCHEPSTTLFLGQSSRAHSHTTRHLVSALNCSQDCYRVQHLAGSYFDETHSKNLCSLLLFIVHISR